MGERGKVGNRNDFLKSKNPGIVGGRERGREWGYYPFCFLYLNLKNNKAAKIKEKRPNVNF